MSGYLGARILRSALAGVVALALVGVTTYGQSSTAPSQDKSAKADAGAFSIRITSPMGRSGLSGAIRIVAQLTASPDKEIGPVLFFVDGEKVGEDNDGAPFAVEWVDANPFERRELMVVVADAAGQSATDTVTLEPFEVVEETQIASVLLEASVEDAEGRPLVGLEPSVFALREDGEPQALDLVRSERTPSTYLLLVDASQSMARRIEFVKDAAATLMGHLRGDDRVIVAPFSREIGPITGPTADRATVLQAVTAIRAKGGTSIVDNLIRAAEQLEQAPGRHAVVLITDGYDEHSRQRLDEALVSLKRSQVTVYPVGIGGVAGISLGGQRLLRQIALETGGRAFFPTRGTELPPVHQQVAADVRNRYLVAYTPSNQRKDGKWRELELLVSVDGSKVRTRPGYFAPSPPPIRPSLEFSITGPDQEPLDIAMVDLEVTEDGVPQKLDVFQEAVAPVSIVLALDSSGSMRRNAEAVKDAARRFVSTLRPEDSLALVTFADRVLFEHDFSINRALSLESIEEYTTNGGTSLYDAVALSLGRLKAVQTRRALVVLTDGRDENNPGTGPGSQRTLPEVRELVQDVDAMIFTLGLGPNVDREPLRQLAGDSGGQAYFPSDISALDSQYRRIVENLRRRYRVSYTSTNAERDGAWRKVEIRSRVPNAVVSSRNGYYAPTP